MSAEWSGGEVTGYGNEIGVGRVDEVDDVGEVSFSEEFAVVNVGDLGDAEAIKSGGQSRQPEV